MLRRILRNLFVGFIATASFTSTMVYADTNAIGIAGKNGWLFVTHDLSTPNDVPRTDASIDLIRRFNKVLAANGITMALALTPMKMRIYKEYLPTTVHTNDAMMGKYDYTLKKLGPQVNMIDLNTAFMTESNRINGPYPLFLKLDSHWSPSGVLLAAQTIKNGIESNQVLNKAFDSTTPDTYKLEISKNKKTNNSHDLTSKLPVNDSHKTFTPEESLLFSVTRVPPKGNQSIPKITLLGTSNSKPWTGFSDALNYTLQRDILVDTTLGEKGQWIGAEIYLSSDSFQKNPPKLLIWEFEERDLRSPPSYEFRDARYRIDDTEWLLRVSALVQPNCKASSVSGQLNSSGLATTQSNLKSNGISVNSTLATDFIEYVFNKPLGKLDYLSANISSLNSNTVTLEAEGPDTPMRQFTVAVPGDSAMHSFKYPLPSGGKGYTKVRIYPGKTSGFSFQGLKVCRQPDDLLK